MVLSRTVFQCVLAAVALLPLVLLGRLWLGQSSTPSLPATSLGFFLCTVATIAFWMITNGQTNPPFADMGIGLYFWSMLEAGMSGLLSVACGLCCLRTRPSVLLWLVPTVLLLAAGGVGAWYVFH